MILPRKDAPITNEIIDVKTYLFLLNVNEKASDLLYETTVMNKLLAKN